MRPPSGHPGRIPVGLAVLSLAFFSSHGLGQELSVHRYLGPAGGPGSEDGSGSEARFFQPTGLATDEGGNLYVADGLNHLVRMVTPAGEVRTVAGLGPFPSWADGRGADARLELPRGILTNPDGDLEVLDYRTGRVRIVSPSGRVGTLSVSGLRPSYLSYIAKDSTGVRYLSDLRNRILRMSPDGIVSVLAGAFDQPGSRDGTGAAARFYRPAGLAVNASGDLFVADSGTIRRVSPGGTVTTFAGLAGSWGWADGTGSQARFAGATGLCIDAGGVLYVADTENHTVRRIDPSGVVTTIAGSPGVGGSVDGPPQSALLFSPTGIAVDRFDNIYVSEPSHTIRRIDRSRNVTTLAGLAGYRGPSGFTPFALAKTPDGRAIIIDGHSIREVSPNGVVTTLAGDVDVPGLVDGPGSQARFRSPNRLVLHPNGSAYVSDHGNSRIRRVSPDGTVSTLPSSTGSFVDVSDLAVLPSGDLLVAAYGLSRVTLAGRVSPIVLFSDALPPAVHIRSVAVDSSGKAYVGYANVIVRTEPSWPEDWWEISLVAGSPDSGGVLDGVGADARIGAVSNLTPVSGGRLLFIDGHTIRQVTPGGAVTTLAGAPGHAGSSDGTGSAARFFYPQGVAEDASGSVFVADTLNHAIRRGVPALPDRATIDSEVAAVGKPRQLGTSPSTAASWSWRLIRRPSTSKAELSDPRAASPTFVPDVPDLYVFRLDASDFQRESITTVSLRAVDFGDVTGDGRVDVFDLVTLAAHLVGNATPGAAPFLGSPYAARLNAGEKVDVFDLVVLAAYLAGNVAEIPTPQPLTTVTQ